VTITIVAKHKKPGCRQRNAASATGAGAEDANPADNLATVSVCAAKVSLRLTKLADTAAVVAGRLVSYTIRVRNPTKGTARNVRTCDRLPQGLMYVSSKAKAEHVRGRYCWRARALGPGKSKRYRITARALASASGRKLNRATSSSPDGRARRATRAVRVLRAQGGGGRCGTATSALQARVTGGRLEPPRARGAFRCPHVTLSAQR
jgi:uncharacterized repeat protein (TIGR01451 family)